MTCACKPGTYADGWQERRCPSCERAEIEAFGLAMQCARARMTNHAPDTAQGQEEEFDG